MTRGGVSEAELASKAVAPRVTLEQIETAIISEHYFTATQGVIGAAIDPALEEVPEALDLLTFCVLQLWNGYTVHGISACADPANFDYQIGRRIARSDAVNKIWPLLGFQLKTRLALQSLPLSDQDQGADRTVGASEAQPSASSPEVSEKATV